MLLLLLLLLLVVDYDLKLSTCTIAHHKRRCNGTGRSLVLSFGVVDYLGFSRLLA